MDAARPHASHQSPPLTLDDATVDTLRSHLPRVAAVVVAEVMEQVPAYDVPFQGRMGQIIEKAVQISLESFVSLASGAAPETAPAGVGASAASELGQAEARSGRPVEALLAAYRVGARAAWRELSVEAIAAGVDAPLLGRFAELVFTYIDELSAASVAGHNRQTSTAERERIVHLDRLTRGLLTGLGESELDTAAAGAHWAAPRTLTVVLVPRERLLTTAGVLDPRTLTLAEDLPLSVGSSGAAGSGAGGAGAGGAGAGGRVAELGVLLVPDSGGRSRGRLLELLQGREAVVGPARPWLLAHESYARALRARALGAGLVDCEALLPELVMQADPLALADLRAATLAPFEEVAEASAERLAETLRAWLLLQGRRELVAESLHVHPQTVRYRMGQVRELFGDRLNDPDEVLAILLALGRSSPAPHPHAARP